MSKELSALKAYAEREFTPEKMRSLHIKHYLDLRKDISDLSYWYPKIESYNLIQSFMSNMIAQPETYLVRFGIEELLDPPKTNKAKHYYELGMQRVKEACKKVGFPCFIKTGQHSGKHGWKSTCYIESEDQVESHVKNVTSAAACVGCPASLYIVIRKLIETVPLFTAFEEMPITTERRYFVKDNKVIFHHPYWPPNSILRPSVENWRQILEKDNEEPLKEIEHLTRLTEMVGSIMTLHEPKHSSWSVDWLKDKNGTWWLTDMAEADKSFKWKEYKPILL